MPAVSQLNAKRTSATETTGTLTSKGTFWNGTIGSVTNTVKYTVKRGSTTVFSNQTPTISSGNWNTGSKSLSSLTTSSTFKFTITVTDSFNQTGTLTYTLNPEIQPLWIGKNSVIVNDFLVEGQVGFEVEGDNSVIDMTPSFWSGAYLEPFKNYNDNTAYRPVAYKQGNLVTINGIASPTEATSSSSATLFNIPEELRPRSARYCLCQGSNANKWFLTVNSSGAVTASRYGTTTNASAIPSGIWLPFHFTYAIRLM